MLVVCVGLVCLTAASVVRDRQSGKTLENEYCGIFYLKGRCNALGTRQSICLNIFYRYNPATQQATEIERRGVRREWE